MDEKFNSKTPLQKTIFIFKPFCARLASKFAKEIWPEKISTKFNKGIKENAVFLTLIRTR
jgi:hypothetical protein